MFWISTESASFALNSQQLAGCDKEGRPWALDPPELFWYHEGVAPSLASVPSAENCAKMPSKDAA